MTRPWQANSASASRSISIEGSSSLKAAPDEYQFSPTYQEKGADRSAIQEQLTTKINTIVAKLKELGVEESKITLASTTYDNYWTDGADEVVSNTLTISVSDKEQAQKVQDYLLTTSPQGQISPYPTFSNDKRKELENTVRMQALADAKSKADRTADELGIRVGKVITIEDQPMGGIYPMAIDARTTGIAEGSATVSSLPVLSGEQEITYTVKVVYEIK